MNPPSTKLTRRIVLVCIAGALIAALTFRWWAFQSQTMAAVRTFQQMTPELPRLQREDAYVSSNRCIGCHPAEHASWHRTFHRTMTQVAMPDNVVGAFDGTSVFSNGLEYRVFRQGDEFWAEMPDPEIMMYVVQGAQRGMAEQIGEMTYLVKCMC